MSEEKEKLYEPYGSSQESPSKIQQVQEQIDSTKSEIQKTLLEQAKRGKKLGDLEEQTVMLSETSNVFKRTAAKTRNKLWWKDTKWTIILIIVAIIILAIIIVPIVLKTQNKI